MAKPLTAWLVPSFSQHINLLLEVSGRCLHVSVMKFQDKFASLRQVNSPYSWNKFQICCTDMYLIRFLPNFTVFSCFCEFRGFTWILRFHDRAKYQKPWKKVVAGGKIDIFVWCLQDIKFYQYFNLLLGYCAAKFNARKALSGKSWNLSEL